MSKYHRKEGLSHPQLHAVREGNPHRQTKYDREMFESLFRFVDGNRNSFFILLNKPENSDLAKWVNSKIPVLLSNNRFVPTWGTKCVWIFQGMTKFPTCPVCGKEFSDDKNVSIRHGYRTHCSDRCKTLDPVVQAKMSGTCMMKYGVKWVSKSSESRQKSKQTCRKKYGVDNVFQTEWAKEKSQQTKKERYGDENWRNHKQRIETCLEKYGKGNNGNAISETLKNKTPEQKNEWIANGKKSKKERYGDENWNNHEQAEKTCLERYGAANPSKSDAVKVKTKETFLQKYGYDHDWKVPEIREKIVRNRKFYEYNGLSFDSKAEICFYIGCKDGGIRIEREPEALRYSYKGEDHVCFYDFRLNGSVKVEIKGDHFFRGKDRTKEMICPWCPKAGSGLTKEYLDGLAEAKRKRMDAEGVVFLTSNEYGKYIEYVRQKYGDEFIAGLVRRKKS